MAAFTVRVVALAGETFGKPYKVTCSVTDPPPEGGGGIRHRHRAESDSSRSADRLAALENLNLPAARIHRQQAHVLRDVLAADEEGCCG